MDTISRETNSSYLPVAGVIIGLVALLLASVALYKTSSLGKKVPENLPEQLTNIEGKADSASAAADRAVSNLAKLQTSVQSAFDSIGPEIGSMKASIAKFEEAAKTRGAAPKAVKSSEPVVAGPDEYVVKPGDTGTKIAKEKGVPLNDLEAVNPGIDWKHLRVGQKLKVPGK
jgi:LysM repeat protein